MTLLYRITAPHFCAGLVVSLAGTVLHAAPILGWARGKTIAELFRYCGKQRWHMALLSEHAPAVPELAPVQPDLFAEVAA